MTYNKRFDSQIIEAVSEIAIRLGDEAIFCGSLVLKMHGLLDRIVHDLDVITKTSLYGTEGAESLLFRESSGRFKIGEQEVLCVHGGTKVGISVDYFYINSWDHKHKFEVVDWYDGIKIQIQNADEAVAAKLAYIATADNVTKHQNDMKLIMERLGSVYVPTTVEPDDLPY